MQRDNGMDLTDAQEAINELPAGKEEQHGQNGRQQSAGVNTVLHVLKTRVP